jgi:hypothetical protein
MNVTRDVIVDLWPVYESGEASEDTRLLIEEFLRNDPEFARNIREAPEPSLRANDPPLNRERDLETLQKTKVLVRMRDAVLGLAIFLTVSPLTVYDTSWGSGWVIRDHPVLAVGLATSAAIVWGIFLILKRRLSVSGL